MPPVPKPGVELGTECIVALSCTFLPQRKTTINQRTYDLLRQAKPLYKLEEIVNCQMGYSIRFIFPLTPKMLPQNFPREFVAVHNVADRAELIM